MNVAKIAKKIQEQMHQFSGKLSQGLPKTAGRFVEEALYGIQSRGSVRLSEIARALNEAIPLQKTINRLSTQLKRPGAVGVTEPSGEKANQVGRPGSTGNRVGTASS